MQWLFLVLAICFESNLNIKAIKHLLKGQALVKIKFEVTFALFWKVENSEEQNWSTIQIKEALYLFKYRYKMISKQWKKNKVTLKWNGRKSIWRKAFNDYNL